MVFDLEGSLQRMGGDLELFRDLTEYFFADAPPLVERIALAIERDDAGQLERAAHSVKGLAANFGAAQVVASAARLEDLGRQGFAAEGASALVDLQNALAKLFEELAAYRR
ncbi:MAG: Hpt domain-containing protein [Pirellulales bacterium]